MAKIEESLERIAIALESIALSLGDCEGANIAEILTAIFTRLQQ